MGMISAAFEIMVIPTKGESIIFEMWLDNEAVFELNQKQDLFKNVNSISDILKCMTLGFRETWDEDIDTIIENSDYDGSFAKFARKINKISLDRISSVVLMTNVEQEFGNPKYKYEWIKYELSPYRVFTGISGSESNLDAMDFLRSLRKAGMGQELEFAPCEDCQIETKEVSREYDLEQSLARSENEWMTKYGQYVDNDVDVEPTDKIFVLSGMEALSDSIKGGIENAIIKKGGQLRSNVSGKTDYLVVDPAWSGESKVKEAIKQREKGKKIRIILGTTLLTALDCE